MKPGQQLESVTCGTKVVVVRAPDPAVVVECGGKPMAEPGAPKSGRAPDPATTGTALGKRYIDEATGVELLCIAAGAGDLVCAGTPMVLQGAKPLPSSD